MIRVGIIGGSGYVGGELLRLLLDHQDVTVVGVTSERSACRRVDGDHPNLRCRTDLTYSPRARLPDCDAVFLAGHGLATLESDSLGLVPAKVVIDLTPDLRLGDPGTYQRYYGRPHPAPHLLGTATAGWPERERERLRVADRISVPGCMANAAILALYPVADLVSGPVLVDGRVGSSGSGATAGPANLHAERSGALRVFAPLGHRHEAEISQALGLPVRMTATGTAAVRGVQVICQTQVTAATTDLAIRAAFRDRYDSEPFVRIVAARRGSYRYPEPKLLLGSNYCDVGYAYDESTGQLVLIGALDNLVKGSAGNAVQCFNIRHGLAEDAGLRFPGLHPI